MAQPVRLNGSVKWFNESKGYGFITGADQNDYFVHITEVRKSQIADLREGDAVSFEVAPGRQGRKQAANLQSERQAAA